MPWTGWPRIPVQPGRCRTDRQQLRRLRTDGCSPRRHRPEAELWVIEQENLHRNWLVTGVRLDAGEAG